MGVGPPGGEPLEKAPDPLAVGVKEMRAVEVDPNPMLIRPVGRVPPHRRAGVHHQHPAARLGEKARERAAGKAGADDGDVKRFLHAPTTGISRLRRRSGVGSGAGGALKPRRSACSKLSTALSQVSSRAVSSPASTSAWRRRTGPRRSRTRAWAAAFGFRGGTTTAFTPSSTYPSSPNGVVTTG